MCGLVTDIQRQFATSRVGKAPYLRREEKALKTGPDPVRGLVWPLILWAFASWAVTPTGLAGSARALPPLLHVGLTFVS